MEEPTASKSRGERQREWRERLSRFASSNLSAAEFCRRERVSEPSFYQWRKRLAAANGQATTTAAFVPVQVTATEAVRIAFPNGVVLTLPGNDRDLIKACIEAIAVAHVNSVPRISGDA